MLSIGKIALGQHRYYEQQVARGHDDYYSGRGEAPGRWIGAGAAALGLQGRVTAAQFNALTAGVNPADPQLAERLRASERDLKIAALDLTFSAPKSISVLFAVAPERVAGELVAAHEDAVDASLSYVEDAAVFVRRGHGGVNFEHAGGLVAAAYRHRMSRALDPQLHTHVVAANLARGEDGRWTALHHPSLYRAAKTAGYLYQAHLRAAVRERLGLEWGEVHKGAADLDGVSAEVLSEFSRRTHDIERALAAEEQRLGRGLMIAERKSYGTLATRERKQYGIATHTWREEVAARAGEHGLDREAVDAQLEAGQERLARGLGSAPVVDERAIGDQLAGAHGLTERANTFGEGAVLQRYAAAARQGATVERVRGQSEAFAGRGDVLATQAGEMTTADLVACERRLVAAAVGRADERAGLVDERVLEQALAAADRPLTAGQVHAVRETVRGGQGVQVIEALAGTGKTFTAGVLRCVYESAGYGVPPKRI